jgi:hypothetical protein
MSLAAKAPTHSLPPPSYPLSQLFGKGQTQKIIITTNTFEEMQRNTEPHPP